MALLSKCCLQSSLCYAAICIAVFLLIKYSGILDIVVRPLRKKFAAWCLSRVLPSYHKKMKEYKEELFASIESGSVLEIGVGYGGNLDFYQKGTKLTVCEPNEMIKPYLLENLKGRENVKLEKFIVGKSEDLSEIPSGSMSAVVCTLVLCSVDDVGKVLKEILRVLKPGGKFHYLEHVLADEGTLLYYVHYLIEPLWSLVHDGCRTTLKTWNFIEQAGFSEVKQKRFYTRFKPKDLTLYLIRPHLMGVAVK